MARLKDANGVIINPKKIDDDYKHYLSMSYGNQQSEEHHLRTMMHYLAAKGADKYNDGVFWGSVYLGKEHKEGRRCVYRIDSEGYTYAFHPEEEQQIGICIGRFKGKKGKEFYDVDGKLAFTIIRDPIGCTTGVMLVAFFIIGFIMGASIMNHAIFGVVFGAAAAAGFYKWFGEDHRIYEGENETDRLIRLQNQQEEAESESDAQNIDE